MSNSTVEVPDDWWPDVLRIIADEEPLGQELVLVAEQGNPWGEDSFRHLTSALVPVDQAAALLAHRGPIGHVVSASGPHPVCPKFGSDSGYVPDFWISTDGVLEDDLEPLVVSWSGANFTYLAPDQGFLMTFGLIPRVIEGTNGPELRWDDLTVPRRDVVISSSVSEYDALADTHAFVKVHVDYLKEYASLRNCEIVQVYFAQRWATPSPEIEALMNGRTFVDFTLPGRLVNLQIVDGATPPFLAQVWGLRPLLGPSRARVTGRHWEYGDLTWPGVDGVVTHDRALDEHLTAAYVSDKVLGEYEDWPDFTVHPESGTVSYGGQWNTSRNQRIGRDLIQVNLKSLYEGTPASVVHTWHRYAVAAPTQPLRELRDLPNIASRSRLISYAVVSLGELLAILASRVLRSDIAAEEMIGLSREKMDYAGWWSVEEAERISRHAPLDMTQSVFLSRCVQLKKLVVEGLKERRLRELLVTLGDDEASIRDFKSIRLLARVIDMGIISRDSGLRLVDDAESILGRLSDLQAEMRDVRRSPIPAVLALNDLRILEAHRVGDQRVGRLREALTSIGIDTAHVASGWGTVLDALYDTVLTELVEVSAILESSTDS